MTDAVSLRAGMTAVQPLEGKRPESLKDAAGKFEAMLIGQMLKSARETDKGGWSGEEADQSSSAILDLADQHLADLLGAQGSFGLARMVVNQLGQPAPGDIPRK
jgi:Rod binding domain-containing protein